MASENVGGIQPIKGNKYTMENLGIKEGSKEASIFNMIDESDGVKNGYLTENQYLFYQQKVALASLKDDETKLIAQMEDELQKEYALLNAKLDILRRYNDAKFKDKDGTVTIKSLDIYDFDVSTIENFQKLNMRIVKAESMRHIFDNKF